MIKCLTNSLAYLNYIIIYNYIGRKIIVYNILEIKNITFDLMIVNNIAS